MSDVTREEFDELKRQVGENTKRLSDGDATLKLIDYRLKQMDDKLEKIDVRVQAIQEKPAKRWNSVTDQVLSWLVAALLAFIAFKIGLG